MYSRANLEHLSIFYYIKDGVLGKEFHQEVQNEPLIYDSALDISGNKRLDYKIVDPVSGTYGSFPTSKGRGWLSFEFEETAPCSIYNTTTSSYVNLQGAGFYGSFRMPSLRENSLIKVRDQYNNIISRDYYQLDYEGGRVRWPLRGTPSGALDKYPTKIDYVFHMISVVDGYPENQEIPPLPIVAIYPLEEKFNPLQIGPGVIIKRNYAVDVFASNNSEKRNILDILHEALYNKSISVIDFNRTGEPLEPHGVINDRFITDIDYQGNIYTGYLTLNPGNGNILYFVKIETYYNASPRESRSSVLQHAGKITFSTEVFIDRDPKLVGKFNMLEPPGGLDSLVNRK